MVNFFQRVVEQFRLEFRIFDGIHRLQHLPCAVRLDLREPANARGKPPV
jgi:hypothetical protein